MSDDDQKKPPFEPSSKDTGGRDDDVGAEEDATRQITGDALKQIRESAGEDMAPEWLEKMRARKREAEEREDQDFDTPVPDAVTSEATPATEQMDPDHVGSLTAGMNLDEEPEGGIGLEESTRDNDTTEIERDATKAINRGELDTLMKAKEKEKEQESELGDLDSNVTSERSLPGAGVISKSNKAQSDKATREVEDEAAQAVEESTSDDESSGFSLPKPGSRPSATPDDDGLDDDSFGDFSDEDLHAVVFGEEDEADASTEAATDDDELEQAEPSPGDSGPREVESPSLDFSDMSSDETSVEESADAASADVLEEDAFEDVALEDDAEVSEPEPLVTPDEDESDTVAPAEDDIAAATADPEVDADVEPDAEDDVDELPDDFPDYDAEPGRPVFASVAGYLGALAWIVGGALAMFTSLPSPWDSMIPPAALGAGIVMFLLVMVGPPKWIEASILALLGIGIGGFAFVRWTDLGTVSVTDALGMAPLVGAALALIAAIATLIRPSGQLEEL